MTSVRKKINVALSWLNSQLYNKPIYGHLWLTRRCNIKCDYCGVVNQQTQDMSFDLAKLSVDKFKECNINAVGLMGGEPLVWKNIENIIGYISSKNILVYLSTNGKLLNDSVIDSFAYSGLDVLDVSVDAIEPISYSKKTLSENPALTELLEYARRKHGIKVKINHVITSKSGKHTLDVLNYAMKNQILISLGIVVRPQSIDLWKGDELIPRHNEDIRNLENTLDQIIDRKQAGQKIVEPLSYFVELKKFLTDCNKFQCKASKYHLQVDVDGQLLYCSRYLKRSDFSIKEVTKDNISIITDKLFEETKMCTIKCYSNCAYNITYYSSTINGPLLLWKVI